MERKLKIDPEFQNKIPPLTDAEFKQLEENIIDAGEVYEPITVWNDTIIDGHNRYKIILMHPGIRWRVREAQFEDKWSAFDWMYKNQLGRRNLTEEQRTYLLGKLYEARKHSHGAEKGGRGNQYTEVVSTQKEYLPNGRAKRIDEIIGEEQGVNHSTVQRAAHYANGIDAIREDAPELADEILNAKKNVSKKIVQEIGHAHPEARKQMIDDIRNDRKPRITKAETKELTKIADTLSDDTNMEYTIEHLAEQIRMNSDAFIRSLSNLLMDHTDLCNEYPDVIVRAVDESITKRINQIKETLNNGTQL